MEGNPLLSPVPPYLGETVLSDLGASSIRKTLLSSKFRLKSKFLRTPVFDWSFVSYFILLILKKKKFIDFRKEGEREGERGGWREREICCSA